jgi:hypothetical protein
MIKWNYLYYWDIASPHSTAETALNHPGIMFLPDMLLQYLANYATST